MKKETPPYYFLAIIIFTLALLIPVFFNYTPPLYDYPLHAGRLQLLSTIDVDPFVQEYYEISEQTPPYIIFDKMNLVFMKAFSLKTSMSISIGLILVLLFTGTISLHRLLFGYFSYWPLVSAVFLYSDIFRWGFFPYLLGLGLLIWAVAGWVFLENKNFFLRLVYGMICSLILYFTHLFTIPLFFIILLIYEGKIIFDQAKRNKENIAKTFILLAITFLFPFIILSASSQIQKVIVPDLSHNAFNYQWRWKFGALYSIIDTDFVLVDKISYIFLSALTVYLFAFSRLTYCKNFIYIPFCLLACFLFLPYEIQRAEFIDIRILPLILLIFIASTDVTFLTNDKKYLFFILVFSFIIIRGILISLNWANFDKIANQYLDSFKKLEPRSTLITGEQEVVGKKAPLFLFQRNIGSLAPTTNSIFTPNIHSDKESKLIIGREKYKQIFELQARDSIIIHSQKEFNELIEKIQNLRKYLDPKRNLYLLVIYEKPFSFKLPEDITIFAEKPTHKILMLPPKLEK